MSKQFTLDKLVDKPNTIRIINGDAKNIPYPDNHFDSCVCIIIFFNLFLNKYTEIKCPVCKKLYIADIGRLKHGRQTSCSRKCSYKHRFIKIGKDYECATCGKVFYRCPSQVNSRHKEVFCSNSCAYKLRKRIVDKPYNYVTEWDRSASGYKAWETRRKNNKPYPEEARIKAIDRCLKNIDNMGKVSKFEKKVGIIFSILGITATHGIMIRNSNGTFAFVFDYYLPIRNVIIECHGTYYHGGRFSWIDANSTQMRNLIYEEKKNKYCKDNNIPLRIIWEHEFKKDPICTCLTAIR